MGGREGTAPNSFSTFFKLLLSWLGNIRMTMYIYVVVATWIVDVHPFYCSPTILGMIFFSQKVCTCSIFSTHRNIRDPTIFLLREIHHTSFHNCYTVKTSWHEKVSI